MTKSATTRYSPLEDYLRSQPSGVVDVAMTFDEVEGIIGDKLPASAFKHRPWWSNNASNSTITNAWLNAGFRSEQVNMETRRLVFHRVTAAKPKALVTKERAPNVTDTPRSYAVELRHPLFGALKGTIRLMPGTDLTKPVDPKWGDQ
jgi:hypothetical protein